MQLLSTIRRFWNNLHIHPYILSIYVVLSLWSTNLDQTTFLAILRSLVFSLAMCLIVSLVFFAIIREKSKAALMSSLFLLLFFYFGHVSELIHSFTIFGINFGRYRFQIIIWAVILFVGIRFIVKNKKSSKINAFANGLSLFLLLLTMIRVIAFEVESNSINRSSAQPSNQINQNNATESTDGPDVYYIVVDSYGRHDELLDDYQFDNSDFISQLSNLGFVFPSCTHSNYQRTETSLTSSLNMNYLDKLNIPLDKINDQISALDYSFLIKDSLVRKEFTNLGYQFVSFKSIYPFINIPDSDIFYDVESTTPFFDKQESINFYHLFLRTTVMRVIVDAQENNANRFDFLPAWALKIISPRATLLGSNAYKLYKQNLYSLEKLENIPNLPGRKFVYAHLYLTHPPFAFNADGTLRTTEVKTNEDDYNAYVDNVTYATKRLTEVIKTILQNSPTPPIIILQGDHSYPMTEDRTKILNAYFLPNGGSSKIYPDITPVNSFRVILDYYFHTNYGILPDISFSPDNIVPIQPGQQSGRCLSN